MKENYSDQRSSNYGQAIQKALIAFLIFCGYITSAQVYVPYSGSNTIACGFNTQLQDHSGFTGYSNYAQGYTVIDAGPLSTISINGPYDTEQNYDYINIYSGIGTGGTLLGSYDGFGNINFTAAQGQVITVEFTSDGSVTYTGFDLTVSFAGSCFSSPCAGPPPSNTVVASSTLVCPGSPIILGTANLANAGGLTIQWKESMQSAGGPFTTMGAPIVVTGPTSMAYNIPAVSADRWYSADVSCATGGTTTLVSEKVNVQGITVNTVPYLEDFEGIVNNNELPNCSWTISDVTRTQTSAGPMFYPLQPNSGSNFAYFNGVPGTGSFQYFFSNGIQLNAGVTYSASMWYQTPGYASWTDLAIMLGQNQVSAGLTMIKNLPQPNSGSYASLSNTFTVPNSGVYYVAIRAKGNFSWDYLAWDDLAITAPCEAGNNAPHITVSGKTTVCAGQNITLSASGAPTYTWSEGGNNNPSVVVTPTYNTTYFVEGTNPLTNCTATANIAVTVNQLPPVSVFYTGSLTNTICAGTPITIVATGAPSYTWSQGVINGAANTVTPSTTTSYSVVGSDALGCIGKAVQTIYVNPLPVLSVQSSHTGLMCVGEQATLTGFGALTFVWTANQVFAGNPVMVSPNQTTSYQVTGTAANGCSNHMTYVVGVTDCTGINTFNGTSTEVKVYPNPSQGEFNVELNNGLNKTIEITDLTGRVILSKVSSTDRTTVNMNNFAAGVYYVKIQSNGNSEVIKLIKE